MTDLVMNVEDVKEEVWIDIVNEIKGVDLINEDHNFNELLEKGWTCLTPNLSYEGKKIWIKPENWAVIIQSLKSYQNKENKEIDKKRWMEIIKEKLKISQINEKSNDYEFHFMKYWTLKVLDVDMVIKSQFNLLINKKSVDKWIKGYSKSGEEEYIHSFVDFLSPEEKWNKIYKSWMIEVQPKWETIVLNLEQSQRKTWYNWVGKTWSDIVWKESQKPIIEKMLNSLSQLQVTYEADIAKQKKRIEILNAENLINFDNFEDHFFSARSEKRQTTFFMGPPNTGKTYNSFNLLSEAKKGAYWSPLRLLALEGYETLLDRGVLNDLVTGEERKYSKGSSHVSSTIEMANLRNPIDVAIIDEIQLLTDPERGWAWTQAYLGAPTKHLVLTGSKAAIPYLENMNSYLKEEMVIKELKSDKELQIEESLRQDFRRLKSGDALIAFSRKSVLSWKEALERKGFKVSSIYGHLSPEVRREEARKFREGETDYLVSTDAIGLGLNLPIKRIIFTSLSKFDGVTDRLLFPSEIWQIANRAGRRGLVENGSVATWFEEDEELLEIGLNSEDEKPKDYKWWVQPLPEQIELWNRKLGGSLAQILEVFSKKLLQGHKVFKPNSMSVAISRAEKLKHLKLNITDLYVYATAPVDKEDLESEMYLNMWAYNHSIGKKIKWSDVKDLWKEKESYHSKGEALLDMEKKVRLLTVYRWLTLRFPDIYYGNREAHLEHVYLNSLVEKYLIEIVKTKETAGKGKSEYKEVRRNFL